jgi:hypothetical protein
MDATNHEICYNGGLTSKLPTMNAQDLPWSPDVPSSIRELTIQLLDDLQAAGVHVRVSDQARISYGEGSGLLCSGYFIDLPRAELGIALGKPWQEWAPILLHECSHGAQWRENSELWRNLTQNNRDIVQEFDAWIEGEEADPARMADVVKHIQAAEFDCEQRVVDLIQQYDLPIDIDQYIQKANAYVWYYDYALAHRRWYPPAGAPYEDENVWSEAPTAWTADLPGDLRLAYERAYNPTPTPKFRA